MFSSRSCLVIADDDEVVRRLLAFHAERQGFAVKEAADGVEAMEVIDENTDVVLLDLNMPRLDGFGCLERISRDFPQVPAVILSAEHEAQDAVRAMKLGAVDYITKPFDPDELMAVLRNARRMRNAEKENEDLREVIGGNALQVDFVAESKAMQEVLKHAKKVAALDSTVLLTGESGVGKGVLARAIHAASPRNRKPFVTVSCPAMPRELLESELFGHEKGAFTGATKRRIGKIEAAKGGTLFLDEIGDLPADLQPKLLNVLQELEFQRVGGEASIAADVRIIAATNIDFEQKIKNGEFREDLYYRLSVVPIEIPPLRERVDGLRALGQSLLDKIAKRHGLEQLRVMEDAWQLMESYDWPGNVRQLENLLERAAVFCEDAMISVDELNHEIRGSRDLEGNLDVKGIAGVALIDLEKQALVQTLKLCGGNKAKTARRLGITEKSVYNKLKRHGLM